MVSLRLLDTLSRVRADAPVTDRRALREAIVRGLVARDADGVLRLTAPASALCDAHLRAALDD
jgi:hypothetical protein